MAVRGLAKVGIVVNSVDYTDHLRSLNLGYGQETLDITAMDDEERDNLPGLKVRSLTAEYNQDFASNSIDANHFALIGNTGFTITVRARSSEARSTTNPEYQGSFILGGDAVGPSGTAGDLMTASFTYIPTGGAGWSRLTSST